MAIASREYFVIAPINLDLNITNCATAARLQYHTTMYMHQNFNENATISMNAAPPIRVCTRRSPSRRKLAGVPLRRAHSRSGSGVRLLRAAAYPQKRRDGLMTRLRHSCRLGRYGHSNTAGSGCHVTCARGRAHSVLRGVYCGHGLISAIMLHSDEFSLFLSSFFLHFYNNSTSTVKKPNY